MLFHGHTCRNVVRFTSNNPTDQNPRPPNICPGPLSHTAFPSHDRGCFTACRFLPPKPPSKLLQDPGSCQSIEHGHSWPQVASWLRSTALPKIMVSQKPTRVSRVLECFGPVPGESAAEKPWSTDEGGTERSEGSNRHPRSRVPSLSVAGPCWVPQASLAGAGLALA